MRVIAGSKKRYGLKTPKGSKQRPTTDRIKETLFNLLMDDIYGVIFVDLFAGSGQIGIEALSRGAKFAYFFEKDKEAVSVIRENIEHTDFTDLSAVWQTALPGGLSRIKEADEAFIVFMDPPYNSEAEKDVLQALKDSFLWEKDVLYIIEAPIERDFTYVCDMGYTIERIKEYKTNKHVFLRSK